jgi:hypothetical protein
MYFCFRVLYFQKYKKTITFSITFSMLGAPGVYFLYFLSYLGCVGRISELYCWFVCHHTAALVGVRPQKLCIVVSGWKRLVDIFVWRHCHRLHVAPSSFLLVLLLPSFDRSSSSSCPVLVRSKACVGSIDRPFVFVVKTAFGFHCQDAYTFVNCCFVFVMESSLP